MTTTDLLWAFFRPPDEDVVGAVVRAARAAAALPAERELEMQWAGFGFLSTQASVFGTTDEPSRFGRITTTTPLVHPLLGGVIASCLGIEEAELWDLVYARAYWDGVRVVAIEDDSVAAEGDPLDRSGPDFVAAWLERLVSPDRFPAALRSEALGPADLIIRVVPVTPPGTRPLVRMDGSALMPGMETLRYDALLEASVHLGHLAGMTVPPPVVREYRRACQLAFEALCVQLGPPCDDRRYIPAKARDVVFCLDDRWQHPGEPPPSVEASEDFGPDYLEPEVVEDAAVPCDCSFAGERALLAFPFAKLVVSLDDGAIVRAVACPDRVVTVDASGRYAALVGLGLHFLDLETGAAPPLAPAGLPLVQIDEVLERSYLTDARRGVRCRLPEVADYPVGAAVSSDARHALVFDKHGNGGVFSVSTALLQFPIGALAVDDASPVLELDGRMRTPSDDEPWEIESTASALVLGPDGAFRILVNGAVFIGTTNRFRLGFEPRCAAFDRAGDRLLVATAHELVVIRLGPSPAIDRRFALSGLDEALSLRAANLDPQQRLRLLYRYGTSDAVRATSDEALLALDGITAADVETVRGLAATMPARLAMELP